MTCIIAHRDGWTVSDSRAVQGNYPLPCVVDKVLRLGTPTHSLLGIAGQASIVDDFRMIQHDAGEDVNLAPEIFRQAISELADKPNNPVGSCLLVNNKREIYLYDCLGAVSKLSPPVEFETIGSGGDIAYGYLMRCKELRGSVTIEDAKNAILAASFRDLGVGGEIIVQTLYN